MEFAVLVQKEPADFEHRARGAKARGILEAAGAVEAETHTG
jgi:hypothetical protein